MRNLLDVLLGRTPKPDDRDVEVNALQVKSDQTLERIERLERIARIGRVEAEVAVRTVRTRARE